MVRSTWVSKGRERSAWMLEGVNDDGGRGKGYNGSLVSVCTRKGRWLCVCWWGIRREGTG